jgi:tripartite-type tricarboxylate transporter receptor subunit TctC
VPGYEFTSINGIFAPAKTPEAVINRLNREIVRYLRSPEAKEKFAANGTEATGSSPQELAAAMQSYIAKATKVIQAIKDAGVTEN